MLDKKEKRVYILALVLRLTVFAAIIAALGSHGLVGFGDAPDYYNLAEGIQKYQAFPTLYYPEHHLLEGARPPGYAFFIYLFLTTGLPIWLASLLQIILVSFIPILIMRLAKMISLEKYALAAGIVTAIEPLEVFYSVPLLSDSLAALFFIFGFYLVVKWWHTKPDRKIYLFWAAIAFGLMNYIRPTGLFLYIIIPFAMIVSAAWLDKSRLKNAILGGILFAITLNVILLPWEMRNYKEFGSFKFVSGIERQFYDITAAGVRAKAEGIPYADMQLQMRKEIESILEEPLDMTNFRNAPYLMKPAVEIIAKYPLTYLHNYFFSLLTFFASGNYQYILTSYHLLPDTALYYKSVSLLGYMLWFAILALSLCGIYMAWREQKMARMAIIVYACVICYLFIVVANLTVGVEARHRLFIEPFYFLFASITCYKIHDLWRQRHPIKKS